MEIKIRKAKIEDFKEIQRLNYLLFKKEFDEYEHTLNIKWPYTKKAKEYFRDSIKNSCTLVYEEDNKIVGYMIGRLRKKPAHRNNIVFVELDNMYIEKEYRGRGVGKKMVKMLEKWAEKKGANKLKVGAFVGNDGGMKFYKKLGFKEYEIFFEKDVN